MNLTDRQKQLVGDFLREMAERLDGIPPEVRARTIYDVKSWLQRELNTPESAPLQDAEVLAALRRCSEAFVGDKQPSPVRQTPTLVKPDVDARWLGVCARLAARYSIPVSVVRGGFLILGLLTWPIALVAYIVVFFVMFFTWEGTFPSLEWSRLTKWTIGALAVILMLHLGAFYAIKGIRLLTGMFLPLDAALLASWDWLAGWKNTLLFWTLAMCVPLSVLGALPMVNGWDYSARRLTQAGIAIYAAALSFGIASSLVGIILQVVQKVFA